MNYPIKEKNLDPLITSSSSTETQAPLLELDRVRIGPYSWNANTPFQATGHSLACVGRASIIVQALVDPQIISQGSIRLLNAPPQTLLAEHRAGYVPAQLTLPPETRVLEGLLLSARLVDLGKHDVEEALNRTRTTQLSKKRLGELSRLQHRLVGLAHGLCGSPPLLLLEDIYSNLEDTEASLVEVLLEKELENIHWIAAIDPLGSAARSLMMRADEVLQATGKEILPPLSPKQLAASAFWVICKEPVQALVTLLREEGGQVVESPHPSALLVRNLSAKTVFALARMADNCIFELAPAQGRAFEGTHARDET